MELYGDGEEYYPGGGVKYKGRFLNGRYSGFGEIYHLYGGLLY